jgi:branched-chain amino acid transport system ATP-binding protein
VVENLLIGRHVPPAQQRARRGLVLGPRPARGDRGARKVEQIIEFLEIEELRDKPVGDLSYGSKSASNSAARWPASRSCCCSTRSSPA